MGTAAMADMTKEGYFIRCDNKADFRYIRRVIQDMVLAIPLLAIRQCHFFMSNHVGKRVI